MAPFIGVAGADAYLVWKDEGRVTLDSVLSGGGGGFGGLFGGGGTSGGLTVRIEPFPNPNTVYCPSLSALLVMNVAVASTSNSYKYITSALFAHTVHLRLKTDPFLLQSQSAMGVGDETKAVKMFSKQLLTAVKSVHDNGVIHRDVKPDNILFAKSGIDFGGGKVQIKLIDLGGAADLRTGTNYSADETVFDPVYGPPEKYLAVKGVGSLFGSSVGWAQAKPDLFDAFSCGMVILQVACPSLRKGKPGSTKRDLDIYAYDAQAWRDSLSENRNPDFAILDANDGQGWDLVCGLLQQKKKRSSVAQALGHPFLKGV